MKRIPFYASSDDRHASEAIYRTLFDYYMHRKMSEEEIGRMRDPLTTMSQLGFEVQYRDLPSTKAIDELLADDNLVIVTVSLAENTTPHAVLILQGDNKNYLLHDPGPPSFPNQLVPRSQLQAALEAQLEPRPIIGIIFRKAHVAKRLDSYVVMQKPRLSRAFAAKLIEQGRVLVNGKTKKPGYKVQDSDKVTIDHDDSELDVVPSIDLPILYEDDDCLVINKPAGVLTHAQGNFITEATVATFLREHTANLDGVRAGIVHRLDRATSGVLICAKHPAALGHLMEQFATRKATKTYLAVVEGHLKQPAAVIDMPIERNPKNPATFRVGPNGKPSTTQYRVIKQGAAASLVELQPKTGRTHQLRVHLSNLGHPIIGDPLYGQGKHGDRLYLHALSLTIELPNHEQKTFTAPLPPEFEEYVAA